LKAIIKKHRLKIPVFEEKQKDFEKERIGRAVEGIRSLTGGKIGRQSKQNGNRNVPLAWGTTDRATGSTRKTSTHKGDERVVQMSFNSNSHEPESNKGQVRGKDFFIGIVEMPSQGHGKWKGVKQRSLDREGAKKTMAHVGLTHETGGRKS